MPSDVTREEFEARVGVLEREVEGEKMVTRHILEQTRRNGDDLAAVKARLNTMDQRFDQLEGKVEAIDRKVEAIDRKVDSLTKTLPEIVGDAVREANRGRRKKR
jgi:chromosome segregation ATPase